VRTTPTIDMIECIVKSEYCKNTSAGKKNMLFWREKTSSAKKLILIYDIWRQRYYVVLYPLEHMPLTIKHFNVCAVNGFQPLKKDIPNDNNI